MAKKQKPMPNRLLASGYILLTTRGPVGVVVLETDDGIIDFGVNKLVATELRDNLSRFLEGKPSPTQDGVPGNAKG